MDNGMDLSQAIDLQQKRLHQVDQAMLERSREGRLTDYYLVQWYYQHVLNQVFHGLLKHHVVQLPNDYESFKLTQGQLSEFQWFLKLAPYSKLMQQSSTYRSLQGSVKQVLDQSFVNAKWTVVATGWMVQLVE